MVAKVATSNLRRRTKSRNGCKTCKLRRLKCDETKPACLKCLEKNIECGGYATTFKWVDHSSASPLKQQDAQFSSKQNSSSKDSQLFHNLLEEASLSVVGKPLKDLEEGSTYPVTKKQRRSLSMSNMVDVDRTRPQRDLRSSISDFRDQNQRGKSTLMRDTESDEGQMSLLSAVFYSDSMSSNGSEPTVSNIQLASTHQATPIVKEPVFNDSLTPSLAAIMNFIMSPSDARLDEASMEPFLGTPLSPLELSFPPASQLQDVKAEPTYEKQKDCKTLSHKSNVPDPSALASERRLLLSAEQEQILVLYSCHTSVILSIKCGQNENPWNALYIPLAREYSFVFNSIAAMTLFHLAGNASAITERDSMRSKGYFYMKKCIFELATGLKSVGEELDEISLPFDVALMTCLNLAISESWDTHTSSGIAHLKGARSLIHRALSLIKDYSLKVAESEDGPPEDPKFKNKLKLVREYEWRQIEEGSQKDRKGAPQYDFIVPKNLQLLFNEWIYFHVLSQMTVQSGQDEKGIDLVATITSIIDQTHKNTLKQKHDVKLSERKESPTCSDSELSASAGGIFDNFNCSFQNTDLIDPLLGCAQSLFLIMGKVASLISQVRKEKGKLLSSTSRNSLSIIGKASELRQKLLVWKPEVSIDQVEGLGGESWDVHSCITTAEAYRLATLLYLHQAVPEIPLLPSHQIAERIFVLLASVPTTSNLHIVHIFPLLVGSCEACPGEERLWCEKRWTFLSEKLWIGNIDRAFEVVKEVWRRKDEHLRKKRRQLEESTITLLRVGDDLQKIASEINGLMSSQQIDDVEGGICSHLHWNSVMKEWNWEVFLG